MRNVDTRQELVNKIISLMEQGVDKWREPFNRMRGIPYNPVSNTKYSSYNLLLLMSATRKTDINGVFTETGEYFNDPRWCTFLQAKKFNYKINSGEISTPIYFFNYQHGIKYDTGEKYAIYSKSGVEFIKKFEDIINNHLCTLPHYINILDITSKYTDECQNSIDSQVATQNILKKFVSEVAQRVNLGVEYTGIFSLQKHSLFNFSQMSNVPEYENKNSFQTVERAENIIKNSQAKIIQENSNTMNYYVPSKHEIHLVPRYFFNNEASYYSTAMHELAHWTLGDGLKRNYGDLDLKVYDTRAKEELRAEFSSIFTCAEIGLDYKLENHASYLQSWIKVLNDQPHELFLAVQDANLITDHIRQYDHDINLNSNIERPQYIDNLDQECVY